MQDVPDTGPERRTAKTSRAVAGSEDLLSSADHGWRLLQARRFRQPAATIDFPPSDAETVAILYKGASRIESWIGGRHLDGRARPRHIWILPARTGARFRFHSECEILHLYLNSDLIALAAIDCVPADTADVQLLPRFLVRDPTIGQIADRVTEEMKFPGIATQLFAQCMAQRLAIQLLRFHSDIPSAPPVGATELPDWKLRRVLDYVEEHLDQQVTLADLGELAGMSIFHLVRCFKQSKGVTPHQYVMQRRMEVAKVLLQDSALDIGQITLAVGLCSQSHFAGIFQRHTGMTPTRFRQVART